MKNSLISGSTKSCGCLRKEKSSEKSKKVNRFDISGNFGIGYDSKEKEFYFDIEDFDTIKDIYWFVNNHGYVMSSNGKMMHQILLSTNKIIDHINHVTNDNRKSNLRIVTAQQNMMNSTKQKNNTSGITGVTWHKNDKKWQAQISFNNKTIYLGSFIEMEDAIKARHDAEEKYFKKSIRIIIV